MILNNTLTITGGGADNIRTPIIYSYVGTGEYGPDHPNVITLDFEPVFIQLIASVPNDNTNNGIRYLINTGGMDLHKITQFTNVLTTSYKLSEGLASITRVGVYGKKSADNKSIYWYISSTSLDSDYTSSAEIQYNSLNTTYYLLIF